METDHLGKLLVCREMAKVSLGFPIVSPALQLCQFTSGQVPQMVPLLAVFPSVSSFGRRVRVPLGPEQDTFLSQGTQSQLEDFACDSGHFSLPPFPLVSRGPSTADSGLPVPANSVIIQAAVEIMAVKGKKCFIREQRQGKVFIRMTLAVCSVFSQGLG